ncbi:VIT domain-containing protein [Sphingomonas aurantiaca]|uniref:VIT domain-containing protein n=1 Tax=Sphingomonas aurantiaca TaxID=185949 RepID=UPI002FE140B1
MSRLLMLAVAIATLSSAAWAQNNPTLSEAERGIRRDDGPAVHLRIDALDLRAHLVGRIADVSVEMLIGSDDADGHEANLSLTLPADAVVTGYALDVGGRMIPGQLLEAPKARNVYEDEVRAGIDPGLAEVVGNRFTTRIFPVDAAHPRRFRLTFVAALDPAVGLVLPFARDAAIGRVTVAVDADGYATAPSVRFAGQPLDLTRSGESWRGEAMLGRAVMREGLTITGGAVAAPMVVTHRPGGQAFSRSPTEHRASPRRRRAAGGCAFVGTARSPTARPALIWRRTCWCALLNGPRPLPSTSSLSRATGRRLRRSRTPRRCGQRLPASPIAAAPRSRGSMRWRCPRRRDACWCPTERSRSIAAPPSCPIVGLQPLPPRQARTAHGSRD